MSPLAPGRHGGAYVRPESRLWPPMPRFRPPGRAPTVTTMGDDEVERVRRAISDALDAELGRPS